MPTLHIWLKGILAAAISGAAGGVLTGFAAVGIDPQHFNLNAVTGVAAYLQKSPLPEEGK